MVQYIADHAACQREVAGIRDAPAVESPAAGANFAAAHMPHPTLRRLVLPLRWFGRLARLACTAVLVSCAPPKPPVRTPSIARQRVTVARQMAYAQSADEGREAYRATIAG